MVPGGVLCALRINEFCGGGFASSPDASASRSFAYPRPPADVTMKPSQKSEEEMREVLV